ncbi:MAG: ABC transporter ATP-binding protein [Acetobacteraceae bacterium]
MGGVSITLQDVVCRHGTRHALDGIRLSIREGEFLVVLGASGCGKTTLLRAIAGFHPPDNGQILFNGRIVSGNGCFIPPEQRDLGIVFQSYALWPHMTVSGNVGFGLTGGRPEERRRRVAAALELVGLAAMASRRPAELSGGQRQRVALARCLAKAPAVVLMDEPLANLDPELRDAVQREFVSMHRRLGSTFVYVTHDQAEALALADRIALMQGGRILECDEPQTIWSRPRSAVAARFLGGGTLVDVAVAATAINGRCNVVLGGTELAARCGIAQAAGPAVLRVRPNDLALDAGGPLSAVVKDVRYRGSDWLVRVTLDGVEGTELEIVHRGVPPPEGARIGIRVLDGWVLPNR